MNIKLPSRSSWFRALLLIFTRAIILLLGTHFLNTLRKAFVDLYRKIGEEFVYLLNYSPF
jgi:hypothetical protein